MSASTASVGRPASIAARSAPAADRIEPSMSNAMADSSRASAAWIAVALVLSRYAGSAVAKYTAAGASRGAPRRAARAASTPMEVVSSS